MFAKHCSKVRNVSLAVNQARIHFEKQPVNMGFDVIGEILQLIGMA